MVCRTALFAVAQSPGGAAAGDTIQCFGSSRGRLHARDLTGDEHRVP